MTFCKRCGVRLRDNSGTCVLCGSKTARIDDRAWQEYPNVRFSNRFRYMIRVLVLLSLAVVALSMYINYATQSDTIWSLIVLGSAVYFWTAYLSRKSLKNVGLMIFIQVLAITLLGYLIDLSTGNNGWMLNYVLPFLLIAAQGVIVAIMLVRPMQFRDFLLYLLQIAAMGVMSVLLMVFGIATVRWPYVAAFIYSAVILIGAFLLGDRRTRQELTKRFHF